MAVVSNGASRTDAISLVIERIRDLEKRLSDVTSHELLAKTGPRYQSLREGMIDLNRAITSMFETIRKRRDEEPHVIIGVMVTLAAVATKIASDVAAAAGNLKGSIEVVDLDDFED